MKDEITAKTLEFVAVLKKSDAYVDYLNYKSFLDNQPELLARVDVFRRKSFDIQVGHKYGYFNAYENLLQLNDENDDLLNEPIVRSFLSAELEVSKMINQIYNVFAEAVDFKLDFLED